MAATAALAGYKGILKLSTAAAGSEAKIAEITDFTLDATHTTFDATNHDSSGERERIGGITEFSGTVDFQWVDDSTSQVPIFQVLTGKTKVDFSFMPVGTSSGDHWTGSGFLNGWALTSPSEDVTTISAGIDGTATLTYTSSTQWHVLRSRHRPVMLDRYCSGMPRFWSMATISRK